MSRLVFFLALASVAIAAPGPAGQLIITARADNIPIAQAPNISLPELKTFDAGYYANHYLGRIYGLVNLPNAFNTRQTSYPPDQPVVYTGFSAPLKYIGFPNILDHLSIFRGPWGQHNNQGYGYGPGYHDDDDDDDDDHNGWGAWGGPWWGNGGGWGGGPGGDNHGWDNDHDHGDRPGGWNGGHGGQGGWGGRPGHHDDDNRHDKPDSGRPNVVNQIFTKV